MKKILIAGAEGLLGKKLRTILGEYFVVIPTAIRPDKCIVLDILNQEQIKSVFSTYHPNVVVNAAAYTDVDACEDNKDLAYSINAVGPKNLAVACREFGAKLIQISTDFVFDGEKGNYTEDDAPCPKSHYGYTKLEGEKFVRKECENHIIFRTSQLYGHNFTKDKRVYVTWVIDELRKHKEITVVDDQWVSPTLIDDIAYAIKKLIDADERGLFNCVGSEKLNRFDFAVKIKEVFGLIGEVKPTKSGIIKQKAHRPKDSSLKIDKLQSKGIQMSDVRTGLRILKEQMPTPKGVILAGGEGTRLRPMTCIINKHLLPLYDRPMINHVIEKFKQSGIYDILIVTGHNNAGGFIDLLGNGEELGVRLSYKFQNKSGGISHALALAEDFTNHDKFLAILGDNYFDKNFFDAYEDFVMNPKVGAKLFLKEVTDPQRFGIAEVNSGKILSIEEKPQNPKTNLAVTGAYMYDQSVYNKIRQIKPSARGEMEITDVNNLYVQEGRMNFDIIDGFWSDAGTIESLSRVTDHIRDKNGKH
jgi:glucose-1-phosphate thymidylyltransferase